MWTKSRIQLIRESLEVSNNFRLCLENLMNKYTIEDSVFVYMNGQIHEATQGYFVKKNEYNSLQEAVRNCNISTEGIRVMDNKKFAVGEIKRQLVECNKDAEIFDINRLTEIR